MKTTARTLLCAFLLSPASLPADPTSTAEQNADVTWSRDIAPVFQDKCVSCHREGGGAPFSLVGYRDATRRADTILELVEDRRMPPWHAVGGDIPLLGDRRLSAGEIDRVRAWVEAGRPEGDPAHAPVPRKFSTEWQLGEPDLIVEMEEAYELPADGPDIYRHFVIRTGLTEEKFLKAAEFRPGTPRVVHHALIYADTSGRARQMDGADPAPGFNEMPVGDGAGRQIGGWVPGATPRPLPEGLAHRLPAGSEIVIQTHFHLSGKPERERSRVGLYFGDKPPERPFTSIQLPPVFGAFSGIDLAPGAAHAEVADSFELPVAVRAFGLHPHAHYRGKSLRLTARLPDGRNLVLLNIPKWDMNWQEEYRFAEPVLLPAGTRLESRIVWDNSAASAGNPVVPPVRVRWGLQSLDEMGSIDLFVVPEGGTRQKAEAAMKRLRDAYRDHLIWRAGRHVLGPDKLAVFGELRDRAMTRFDTDGDGYLDATERAAAEAALRAPLP
jgi:mono/diheme cytochrome c family protein